MALRIALLAVVCAFLYAPAFASAPLPKPRPAIPPAVVLPVPTLGDLVAYALRTLRAITDEVEQEVARSLLEITKAKELAEARAYLVKTATPGGTMTRDGVANNIAKLHPVFVLRTASAIRKARASGLPNAGLYSAYRAPAWGVGGFGDKFNSLHSVGMAGDFAGVGRPGSREAKKWFEIAHAELLFNPYGWKHRAEWNHFQVTLVKAVVRGNPLRATITAKGPIVLERMWQVAEAIIRNAPWAGPAQAPTRTRYARRRRHIQVASR